MLTVNGLSSGYEGAQVLHDVSFDDEAGEWRLSDGLGGWGTVLVYNPEQDAWFTDCSYTGSRTDGPFEQSQAEDLAELIWTG